jgi:cytochrome c553
MYARHTPPVGRVTAARAARGVRNGAKEITMKTLTTVSILILAAMPLFAADGAATFDAKCKMCHGADGKKLAKADLSGSAVQAKSDADLVKFLTTDAKHKSKVADEATAKAIVAHIKTLKK